IEPALSRATSRFTPALNAHVYARRRSPSTSGPVVVLLITFPASTLLRSPFRAARQAGLITASPAVLPATGLRQAVPIASLPTGNAPVLRGSATCVVSYASVGAITGRCSNV